MKRISLFIGLFMSVNVVSFTGSAYASDCADFAKKIETFMRKRFPGGSANRHYEMEAYNLTTQLKYIEQFKGCNTNESTYYRNKLIQYLGSLGNPRPNPHDANTYEIDAYLKESLNSENLKYANNNNNGTAQTTALVNREVDDPPVKGIKLSLDGESKGKKKSKKKN